MWKLVRSGSSGLHRPRTSTFWVCGVHSHDALLLTEWPSHFMLVIWLTPFTRPIAPTMAPILASLHSSLRSLCRFPFADSPHLADGRAQTLKHRPSPAPNEHKRPSPSQRRSKKLQISHLLLALLHQPDHTAYLYVKHGRLATKEPVSKFLCYNLYFIDECNGGRAERGPTKWSTVPNRT